jgi:hypothetical protein
MGPERDSIPHVLASVNKFVKEYAEGDLISYACKFKTPQEMVNELSSKITRMSGSHVEKCWMYLNWLTRPSPNLHYFTNFSPRDLKLPLTSQIKAVGSCLGAFPEDSDPLSEAQREAIRSNLTSLGRELFPDDPTIVDYPFFMLGRWMADKKASLELLTSYLLFFDEIYRKTGSSPIFYDIGSRTKSMFERYIRGELEKKRIIFWYEPVIFRLPNGLTYRPDFLLPGFNIEGKKVVLEPHGVWEGRNGDEVAYKYSIFRETYGNEYYLIIIVPSNDYQMVRDRYKGAYDDLIEGNRTPDLLYMLKTGSYVKSFADTII